MIDGRLLERFSNVVDCIYSAALDPQRWPKAVQAVAGLHGSPKANLLTPLASPREGGFIFSHGISESAIQLWGTKYVSHDIWAHKVLERKLMREGNVILGTELVTDEEFEHSLFYSEFLKTLDIWHICTGIVFDGQKPKPPMTAISLFDGRGATGYTDFDRRLHGLTVTHISRALGTMFHLRDAELRLAATFAALDRLSVGVLLFGERGNVMFANRAAWAILKLEDGVKLRNRNPMTDEQGWLVSDYGNEDLQRDILASIQRNPLSPTHFSRGSSIVRRSGRSPYVLQLSTLFPDNEFCLGPHRSHAIGFITDPDVVLRLDPDVLAQSYDLTPAEAALAQELLSGHSLKEIANRLAIRENTAKTQLQAIFAKTQTHRQPQLLRLLMSLAANG
jgi:DNA-binding CsgD family transcriptional regulator/PAS domain-containing protein